MSLKTNPPASNAGLRTVAMQVTGDILSTNVDLVRSLLLQELSKPAAAAGAFDVFELNLNAAKMIDSAGLNLLVWVIKTVRARGARVRLVAGNPNVLRTFHFTRLDQQAEIVP
jgi:anti-anti-sigma factor